MGLLRHQRTFMETRENELQLAGIGVDIADGKNAGHIGLERRSLNRNKVVLKLEAPVRDRTELHRQSEERQHGIAIELESCIVVTLHHGTRQLSALTFQ